MTLCGDYLTKINIRGDIFQGGSLKLVICMVLPSDTDIKKGRITVQTENGERFNHLLLKDDLKIFARSEKEVNELFSNVQKYSVMILGLNFG